MKTTDTDTSKDKPLRPRSETHTDSDDNARDTVSSLSSRRANAASAPDAIAVFRRWTMSVVATPSLLETMLDKMAHCGPKEIPEMIEAIEQAEQVCVAEEQVLRRRWNGQTNKLNGSRLNTIPLTVASCRWGKTREWLLQVRQYLAEELQQHERAAARQRCGEPMITELGRS